MDSAFWDTMRWGTTSEWYFRWDVYRPDWDNKLLPAFKGSDLSADVTRRKLVLGSRDSTTGWYNKSYTEETIEMVILSRGSQCLALVPGVYVREDKVGLTADPVVAGDQIKSESVYYEVKTVKMHYFLDSFMFYECQLAELPLYEE